MPRIKNYIKSFGLPKGMPVQDYNPAEGVKAVLADGLTEAQIVDVLNRFSHTARNGVEGADDLITYILSTGFRKQGDTETNEKYVTAFKAALASGEHKIEGFTPDTTTSDAALASVNTFLQGIVDSPRTVKLDGKDVPLFDIKADIKERVRVFPVSEKTLPKYAKDSADQIIAQDVQGVQKPTTLAQRLANWKKTFTDKKLDFLDFTEAGLPSDQVRLRLAKAIVADVEAKRAAEAAAYK